MDVLCLSKIVWCVSLQECFVFQYDCLACVTTRMFCVSIRLSGVCRYMDVLCVSKTVLCVSLQECFVFQYDCLACVTTRMFRVSIKDCLLCVDSWMF